jgi:hypothetical protein
MKNPMMSNYNGLAAMGATSVIGTSSALSSISALGGTTMAEQLLVQHRPQQRRAAVIGASLGGLGAANVLSQIDNGSWMVDVYERSNSTSNGTTVIGFQNKGSGLGYVNVPAWEAVRNDGVPMIRRGRKANRGQGAFYYGDLWKYLWEGLPDNANIHYGKTIEDIGNDVNHPIIDGIPYDLVVLADGGFSTLRKYILTAAVDVDDQYDTTQSNGVDGMCMNNEPEYSGCVLWRGSVSTKDIPKHLEYQIREGIYKNGIYDTIVLKLAKDNGEDLWMIGTFIATPESDLSQYWDKSKQAGRGRHDDTVGSANIISSTNIPDWFLPLFSRNFDHTPWLVSLVERMIERGEVVPHPQYHFASKQVTRGRVVMIGDAAHMASPRTAVGAHTAIIDALDLRDAFDAAAAAMYLEKKKNKERNGNENDDDNDDDQTDDDPIDMALKQYSKSGVDRAQQLYRRSVEVSKEFIPSGGINGITSPSSLISLLV